MAPREEVWCVHRPVMFDEALLSITHLSPRQSGQLGQLGSRAHPLALLWPEQGDLAGGRVL